MIKTLHGRLTAIVVALFALSTVLSLLFTSSTTRAYAMEERQRMNASLAGDLVRYLNDKHLLPITPGNHDIVVPELHRLMTVNPSIDIYLLDPRGNILGSTVGNQDLAIRRVDLRPIYAFLSHPGNFPIRGTDPHGTDDTVFSVAPTAGGFAYVVLGPVNGSIGDALQSSYALRTAAGALGGVALFSVVSGGYIFWTLTRRLRALVTKVDRVSTELAGTGTDDAAHGCDEIDGLDHAFDSMAGRVRTLLSDLQRADAERRDLVENVTHDLRTPIAGLRGYLETLLMRGESLAPEERLDYLESATRSVDRLNGLIDGMLELARLESVRLEFNPEPFIAAELAQDVAQDFRLRAQSLGIDLRLEADGDTMIRADIALIQRALGNLVENALRHTPTAGAVTLGAIRKDGRVHLSVSDTGTGIAKDDLAKIFDRGVRGSESAGPGAGLGLAIVERIAVLHQAEIAVDSQPGQGTTFSILFPS